MGWLKDKVVLITGAAQGQGRSHALAFAEEGADVIGIDLASPIEGLPYQSGSSDSLAETAALVRDTGRRAEVFEADVRDLAGLREAVGEGARRLGGLDVVVANAGVGSFPYATAEVPEGEWERTIGVNLTGVWATCAASIPHLISTGSGGSIVVISSAAGTRGRAKFGHYSAAKHGVVGLMRSMALELGEFGIRVNAVLPGAVNTSMLVNSAILNAFGGTAGSSESELRDEFARVRQMKNVLPIPWAEASDISNAVVFLASEKARCITGVALPVDAGTDL